MKSNYILLALALAISVNFPFCYAESTSNENLTILNFDSLPPPFYIHIKRRPSKSDTKDSEDLEELVMSLLEEPSVPYATNALDKTARALEPYYIGHDPELISKQLREKIGKSEFETTREHEERLKKGITILSNLRIDQDEFVVSIHAQDYNRKYDADNNVLKFDASLLLYSNVYGGSKGITFDIRNFLGKYVELVGNEVTFKIPMDIHTAKISKEKVWMLIIFKLTEPYIVYDTVFGNINEIWFYNVESGEIYLKLKPNQDPGSIAPSSKQESKIHKCKVPDGKIIYQSSPCVNSTSIPTRQ